MRKALSCSRCFVLACFLVAGCGGDDQVVAPPVGMPAPSPTPTPVPTPTPTPTPGAELIEPIETETTSIKYADPGESFTGSATGTRIPLILTALGAQFSGDAETTNLGGYLEIISSTAVAFTLNNPTLGATNLATNSNAFQSISANRSLLMLANGTAFTQQLTWLLDPREGGGAAIAGFATHATNVPTAGKRSLECKLSGLISELHITGGDVMGLLYGDGSLEIDYANGSVTGRIHNIAIGTDGFYKPGPVNELEIAVELAGPSELYTGDLVAGNSPGGTNAFLSGTKGVIKLRYFGPDAEEVGAVFILSDGTSRAIGTLLCNLVP